MSIYNHVLEYVNNGLLYGFCFGAGLQIAGYAVDKARQTLLTIMKD